MKEASQNAIENARIILAQSLLAENAIDVELLAANAVEDLKLATGATLASLKRVILAPILKKMEERNLRLPVNQLPPEILERIFQEYVWSMCLDTVKPDDVYKYDTGVYSQAVLCLVLVSKRWHHIVFGTPSLWALVSVAMPHAQVDKWLFLSGLHPLDVYCKIDPGETDPDETDSEDLQTDMAQNDVAVQASLLQFVNTVTPHLGRTHLIRVAATRGLIQESLPIVSTPNGTIETLELQLRHPRQGSGFPPANFSSLALFQHQAPKLTCIEIAGIQIDWRCLAYFPALQTLKLSGVAIPTSCIENGLKECLARLRALELREVFMDVDVPAQGVLLDLPNLQRLVCTLHLYDLPNSWETPLISRIRSLHSLETINLSVNAYDGSHRTNRETYFEVNIARLSSDFSRILGSAAFIHIDSNGSRTSIDDTAGSLRFRFINVGSDFLSRRFRDILLENEVSGDVDLSLREHALHDIQRDTWKWPCLNVSRLTLKEDRYTSNHLESVSQTLMSLGDFLKDCHHWSTLRCIRLDFKQLRLDCFAACLKERYSGIHGGSIEPQHLSIHIKCFKNSASGLEELKATHGVDSVILEERGRNYISTPWDDEEGQF